ncbi:hypothetical protein GCM10009850_044890 [Nonomuraea monospora]|uniref:Uncharacterized protein n=2 Tax=Nonomuraea monospora TaxID=568818 RepID=A0ABP5PD99_9ACTN
MLCHVAFVDGGDPVVLPTLHVRVGDRLLIHGARKNRMMNRVAEGAPVCVEATVIDSVVMGRSVLQNSVHYRSAVVMGEGRAVEDLRARGDAGSRSPHGWGETRSGAY